MALWSVAFLGSTTSGSPIIGWFAQHANPPWELTVKGYASFVSAGV